MNRRSFKFPRWLECGKGNRRSGIRGQATLEFALVLPIAVLMFMATMDFAWYFYQEAAMSHAVRESLRFAVSGQVKENPAYPGEGDQYLNRKQSVLLAAKQALSPGVRMYDPVSGEPWIRFTNPETGVEYGNDLGGPGARVKATFEQEVNFITAFPRLLNPNNVTKKTVVVSTVYKTEQYE